MLALLYSKAPVATAISFDAMVVPSELEPGAVEGPGVGRARVTSTTLGPSAPPATSVLVADGADSSVSFPEPGASPLDNCPTG